MWPIIESFEYSKWPIIESCKIGVFRMVKGF
nr:MAG TPA: hypothetical protein [Caudoviricetes sp.]